MASVYKELEQEGRSDVDDGGSFPICIVASVSKCNALAALPQEGSLLCIPLALARSTSTLMHSFHSKTEATRPHR